MDFQFLQQKFSDNRGNLKMGNQGISCKNCNQVNMKHQLRQSAVIQLYNNSFYVKGNLNFSKHSTYKKLQIAASQFCASTEIGVQYIPLVMRLLAFKHDNVFKAFSNLPKQNRIQFIDRIGDINLDLMDSLYQYLIKNQDRNRAVKQISLNQLTACEGIDSQKIKVDDKFDLMNKGTMLLRSGKVAIVFMCGGPSSRFFFQDKFLHPLQINQSETTILKILFQKLRENFKADRNQLINLPILVLGNQSNVSHIQEYLKQHNNFNFSRKDMYVTHISSLPILDKDGKICLNFQFNYMRRPKGSACYLQELLNPKTYQILKKLKVQYIQFVSTQNLSQNPGDPLFIGLTYMLRKKVSIKCTEPEQPYQKFDRIIGYKNNARILDLNSLNIIGQKHLYESCIAMNSLIFQFESIKEIVLTFNNTLQITGNYRPIKIKENLYDFEKKKPLVDQQCWTFQKDIKDVIACVKNPLVLRVNRKQFIPLITYKQSYSIQEACDKYMNYYPKKLKTTQSNSRQSLRERQSQRQFSAFSSQISYTSKQGTI